MLGPEPGTLIVLPTMWTDYVSVSNTLIGFMLLAVGGLTSLESFLAPEELIAGLSLFGLAGAGTALTLPEVE